MTVYLPATSRCEARISIYRSGFVRIGDGCWIGRGVEIHAAAGITIGNDVYISWDCLLLDTDMHAIDANERVRDYRACEWDGMKAKNWSAIRALPITIGNRVWIGTRAMVLPGSRIGEGAVLGAGAVVRGYVPPYTLYAGNPARLLKRLPIP